MIGYARVSTDEQDLTAQRDALTGLGVAPDRIYVDHGLTGTNRARPVLREAMAACRGGDVLVITKLDRLARSLPDARDIVAELTAREVKLSLGGSVHDPTDPVGRLLFKVLAMVAEFESDLIEFESDLIKMRTPEGMKVARAKGRLRGKNPSSARARRPTSSRCTMPARTPAPNSWSCSPSPAPPSTGRSNASTQQLHPGPDVLPCTSGQLRELRAVTETRTEHRTELSTLRAEHRHELAGERERADTALSAVRDGHRREVDALQAALAALHGEES
jgi:DNA invertase Pin-like site-specific DNA recombinase